MSQESNRELAEFIQQIPVVDTHEHFCFPHCLENSKRDILDMIQGMYLVDDLNSAGFGKAEWEAELAPEENGWRSGRP